MDRRRLDIIVCQKLGEPIAPFRRQDRGERVELRRPPRFGVGDQRER
jgi:hypothetical protein